MLCIIVLSGRSLCCSAQVNVLHYLLLPEAPNAGLFTFFSRSLGSINNFFWQVHVLHYLLLPIGLFVVLFSYLVGPSA